MLPACVTSFSGTFHFSLDGHGYFYSQYHPDHSEDKEDWLDARNTCREYCMDLISLETPFENDMIEEFLTTSTYSGIIPCELRGLWVRKAVGLTHLELPGIRKKKLLFAEILRSQFLKKPLLRIKLLG